MQWIHPKDVHSPKTEWTLKEVLYNGGPEQGALALGLWSGKPVLAMRWNGSDERPVGNPQSRGLPTWFVVPDEYVDAILRNGELHMEQVQRVLTTFHGQVIENFTGHLVKMRDTEHQYQVKSITRLPFLAGRVYVVQLDHMLLFDRYDDDTPLPAATALPPRTATFRFHFQAGYKNDLGLFGSGERGDGNHMMARIPILLAQLNKLKPEADGMIHISIPE
jgi:hypothetical protein